MVVNLWTANRPSLFDRIKNTVKWTQTPMVPIKKSKVAVKVDKAFPSY